MGPLQCDVSARPITYSVLVGAPQLSPGSRLSCGSHTFNPVFRSASDTLAASDESEFEWLTKTCIIIGVQHN